MSHQIIISDGWIWRVMKFIMSPLRG